jgi:hypothetical protein
VVSNRIGVLWHEEMGRRTCHRWCSVNNKRRPVPYARVAKMWAAGTNIPEIAKSIRRTGKRNDPFHGMRVILSLMHKGYRDASGQLVKLPYRVSKSSVRLSRKAGKRLLPEEELLAGGYRQSRQGFHRGGGRLPSLPCLR